MTAIDLEFLDRCGLSAMRLADKNSLLQCVTQELEAAVGRELSRNLSDADLEEFSALADGDRDVLFRWVREHAPTLRELLASGRHQLVADQASRLWLDLKCPDLERVVNAERDRIAAELISAAPRLLAHAAGPSGTGG